jgi:hypothetical protein
MLCETATKLPLNTDNYQQILERELKRLVCRRPASGSAVDSLNDFNSTIGTQMEALRRVLLKLVSDIQVTNAQLVSVRELIEDTVTWAGLMVASFAELEGKVVFMEKVVAELGCFHGKRQ